MVGALDAGTGELVVSTPPTKVSADVIALLRRLAWRCGRSPAALDARPWVTIERPPRYAPELNAIECAGRDLYSTTWPTAPSRAPPT